MTVVVSDTGPLLHLHQVGAEHLLAHLGHVQVPPAVWRELQRLAPGFTVNRMPEWLSESQLSASASLQARQWVSARILHAGEAEALACAWEIQAAMFLTDDTAARTLGESLGIQVRGSLGVILHAAACGHLDQTTCLQLLDGLEKRSTLWMSAKVKAAARQAAVRIFANPG